MWLDACVYRVLTMTLEWLEKCDQSRMRKGDLLKEDIEKEEHTMIGHRQNKMGRE